MTTFAEELDSACPSACYEALEWVEERERLGLTENDLWKVCPRGDWLWWLLLDAFAIDEGGLDGPRYNSLYPSLRKALFAPSSYLTPSDENLKELADRIRKLFPEWPL